MSQVSCRQMAPKTTYWWSQKGNQTLIKYFDWVLQIHSGCSERLIQYHTYLCIVIYRSLSFRLQSRRNMIEIIFGANHIFKGIFVCYRIIRHIQSRLQNKLTLTICHDSIICEVVSVLLSTCETGEVFQVSLTPGSYIEEKKKQPKCDIWYKRGIDNDTFNQTWTFVQVTGYTYRQIFAAWFLLLNFLLIEPFGWWWWTKFTFIVLFELATLNASCIRLKSDLIFWDIREPKGVWKHCHWASGTPLRKG